MGQKTNPFGLRLGITEAHKSRWYAPKALYGELLVEDGRLTRCDLEEILSAARTATAKLLARAAIF